MVQNAGMSWFSFHYQDFVFSFLSILFEGIPFLLLGSLLSGAVDAFVPPSLFTRLLPKNSTRAVILCGLLGGIFPMCECGSVIVIRRFIKKGLPVSCAVTYMLGAPIVNPVVALGTFAAFRGQSPWEMMSLRLLLGFVLSMAAGLFVRRIRLETLLQPEVLDSLPDRKRTAFRLGGPAAAGGALDAVWDSRGTFRCRFFTALKSAASDFLDVAFFLIAGAAIAAVFNTAVNQSIILPLATHAVWSTAAMMLLAFGLALCSTSDAFIAASFVAFPAVSKLAFLVFGAMFDIKLFFLYGLVFRRRFVWGLLVGLFGSIALICIRLSVLNL
jgi:uncharacterized membrane protein YraQ (UPF0718 family)